MSELVFGALATLGKVFILFRTTKNEIVLLLAYVVGIGPLALTRYRWNKENKRLLETGSLWRDISNEHLPKER